MTYNTPKHLQERPYHEVLCEAYEETILDTLDNMGKYSLSEATLLKVLDRKVTPQFSYGFSYSVFKKAVENLINKGKVYSFYQLAQNWYANPLD